ncbi:MAG: hypothetical protein AAB971_00575 [Patescibacteria group bacterium]
MNEIVKISTEELDRIQRYWAELTDEQLEAAKKIVPLLQAGDIFEHSLAKRGTPPLYFVKKGVSVEASGTAEMLEYGAAQFEGQKFEPFDEPEIAVAGLRNYLVFPTGHSAPYQTERLSVEQVGGYVDFDNPCVEVIGDVGSSSEVFRLEAKPVLLD